MIILIQLIRWITKMSYCRGGEQPKVKYKFANKNERVYQSNYAPIDVSIKESPKNIDTNNYSNEGFKIKYTITDGNKLREDLVIAYNIGWNPEFGGYWGLRTITCDRPNLPMQTSGGIAIYPDSIIIDSSVKCPSSTHKKCTIEVKHKGIIIYSDQGNCPCTFSVQCGKCLDGQHECSHSGYPGYCCIDCASTASKINNLVPKVRCCDG